jgi:hypothetical protein
MGRVGWGLPYRINKRRTMSALAAYRTAVLALLCDASMEIFSEADVDQALRWALSEYSLRRPLIRTYQFTVVATTTLHEPPSDFITRHITKVELWDDDPDEVLDLTYYAYQADEGWVINTSSRIAAGSVLTIHYSAVHTIDDLDAAAGTTVPVADETLLQTGAAGRCAQMHALSKVETINMNDGVVLSYRDLAADFLASFNLGILKEPGIAVAAITFPNINMVF